MRGRARPERPDRNKAEKIVNETHQGKMIQLTVKGNEEEIRRERSDRNKAEKKESVWRSADRKNSREF